MPKPILYLFRGEQGWMLSRDERATSAPIPFPGLPRGLDVEEALERTKEACPSYEIRVMEWHRPKRDV